MTKIQKVKIVLVACVLSLVAIPAFAAEVFFDTKIQEIKANQLFEVGVYINTDNEEINAIEGKIIFPRDILEIKKINDGNSIINFWIERPREQQETRDKERGEIAFSGIVPGGYSGSQGLIFSITFLAKKESSSAIEFNGVKTLRNDGKGTAANTTISNLQFAISGQAPAFQPAAVEKKDADMPETFEPAVASDPSIFDGKYFLVFATQDKGSGVDHYEVLETRNKALGIRSWTRAESPYILRDQELRSFVFVKAIDKAGNERIAVVEPRYPVKWYEQPLIWVIIITAGIIVYLVWGKFKNK